VKKQLQILQCGAVNRGVLRSVYSATGAGVEHPLRYLKEPTLKVLFQAAAIYGLSSLYKRSMNPDRTPIPRMPRITDLSRFSTMGIRLSTCTTMTAPTWDSEKERRIKGLAPLVPAESSHLRDSVVCTIGTSALPSFPAMPSFIYMRTSPCYRRRGRSERQAPKTSAFSLLANPSTQHSRTRCRQNPRVRHR